MTETRELAVIKSAADEASVLIEAELREFKVEQAKRILNSIKRANMAFKQREKDHKDNIERLEKELAEVEVIEALPNAYPVSTFGYAVDNAIYSTCNWNVTTANAAF